MFRFSIAMAAGLAAVWAPHATRPAAACSVCIGFPEQSVGDWIIASDCVVLARAAAADPFAYAPVEVLKGTFEEEKIELLVDSVTRRRLNIHGDRRVGLVRDTATGRWRSLGVLSVDYESLIRRLVLVSPAWSGSKDRRERVAFFVPLFGHNDPQIRELAYLEMGRAPYPVIRQLGRVTPREHFATMLTARSFIEWRSLAILLLAQSGKAEDERLILDSFHSAERFGIVTNLSAWAAAAIEIQGADAIDFIDRHYIDSSERSSDEIAAVFRALSLHGSAGCIEHRDRIVASYSRLLHAYPEFAGQVASDLIAWDRRELAGKLSQTLVTHETLDRGSRQAIKQYLRSLSSKRELAVDDD